MPGSRAADADADGSGVSVGNATALADALGPAVGDGLGEGFADAADGNGDAVAPAGTGGEQPAIANTRMARAPPESRGRPK